MAVTINHEFHPCQKFNWLPGPCGYNPPESWWPSRALFAGLTFSPIVFHYCDDYEKTNWLEHTFTIAAAAPPFDSPLHWGADAWEWVYSEQDIPSVYLALADEIPGYTEWCLGRVSVGGIANTLYHHVGFSFETTFERENTSANTSFTYKKLCGTTIGAGENSSNGRFAIREETFELSRLRTYIDDIETEVDIPLSENLNPFYFDPVTVTAHWFDPQ